MRFRIRLIMLTTAHLAFALGAAANGFNLTGILCAIFGVPLTSGLSVITFLSWGGKRGLKFCDPSHPDCGPFYVVTCLLLMGTSLAISALLFRPH
jgi:hypothetical protein